MRSRQSPSSKAGPVWYLVVLRAAGGDAPSPNHDPGTLRYLSGTHSNILSQGTIQYNTLSRTKVPSFQVSVGTALQASRTSNFEDHLKYSLKTKSTFAERKKKSNKIRFQNEICYLVSQS